MARINTVAPEDASGRLAEVYEEVRQKRGAIANVHTIHSLHPETMRTHIDFYVSVLYGRSRLTRAEREAVAVAVSHANGCRYCVEHHSDALSQHLKDEQVVAALAQGESGGLDARLQAIVGYAVKATVAPAQTTDGDIEDLRAHGLDDEQILMATLTAAYFNFVNRVVLCLDVDLEATSAAYKY